jgi:hypothetical protein
LERLVSKKIILPTEAAVGAAAAVDPRKALTRATIISRNANRRITTTLLVSSVSGRNLPI